MIFKKNIINVYNTIMVQIKKNKLSKKNIRKYKNKRSKKTIKLLKHGGNPEINIIVRYSSLDDLQEYNVVLDNMDTILSLKKNIYDELGIEIEDQQILFNDREQYDIHPLADVGLMNGSIVYVKNISIPADKLLVINITIKDINQTEIFKLNKDNTVYQLKELLYDYYGGEIEDQRLTFEGKELINTQYLSELGLISNISTIFYEDALIVDYLTIMIVNNNNGKEIIIKIHKNDSVKNLKKIIYQNFLIKIEDQRLIFENSELDDSQILSESGLISNSSVVYVDDTSIIQDM
jgi:hypothetical protein